MRDVTGHAELNVVRAAGIELGDAFLQGATLYTSTEPCAMCAGAIYWSGIGRVVYALGSDTLTAIVQDPTEDSTLRLPCREVFARGGRRVEVSGPHLVEQASAVHAGFWVLAASARRTRGAASSPARSTLDTSRATPPAAPAGA